MKIHENRAGRDKQAGNSRQWDSSANATDGTAFIKSVEWATTWRRRCIGLLGRERLGRDRAMLIVPCRAVHTCFMRFKLDIVFFSRDCRVVRTAWNVGPWRMVHGGRRARGVLEMEAGWFSRQRLTEGDRLVLGRSTVKIISRGRMERQGDSFPGGFSAADGGRCSRGATASKTSCPSW